MGGSGRDGDQERCVALLRYDNAMHCAEHIPSAMMILRRRFPARSSNNNDVLTRPPSPRSPLRFFVLYQHYNRNSGRAYRRGVEHRVEPQRAIPCQRWEGRKCDYLEGWSELSFAPPRLRADLRISLAREKGSSEIHAIPRSAIPIPCGVHNVVSG